MPDSYGDVADRMRAELDQARLADPDEHFPYKTTDATKALKSKTMGPDADAKHDVTGADYTSPRIVAASEAFVAAQQAMLENRTPATVEAYEAATDDLIDARRAHRRARVDADGRPAMAVVAVTDANQPDHMRGPRLRRVGEE